MELSTAILCGLVVKTPGFRVKQTWFKPARWRPLSFSGFFGAKQLQYRIIGQPYLLNLNYFSISFAFVFLNGPQEHFDMIKKLDENFSPHHKLLWLFNSPIINANYKRHINALDLCCLNHQWFCSMVDTVYRNPMFANDRMG